MEFEDYLPKCEKVIFDKGEIKKTVPINLEKKDNEVNKLEGIKTDGRLLDDG